MGTDEKSKSKKKDKDKSEKSIKSKSKPKEKSPQKSPKSASKVSEKSPKKEKSKEKESKAKKTSSKIKKVDSHSDISSISPAPIPSAYDHTLLRDCIHHKSPFIYYCETCEELICNQCTVYGPHNNHLHRILKITDAYRSRVYYLSEAIRTNLVDKRDKIIAQLHRLEYRVEEIRFVKNIIARDIRSEYSGILERLKSEEGIKLAQLTHEVSLVQREIDNINDIGNTFFDLTSLEGDDRDKKVSRFLLKAKNMYEAVEYLLNKPSRALPEIKPEELPREIEETNAQIQKCFAARQINDFKNEVIFNLTRDLKDQEKRIKGEVEIKADNMIRALSEEAENLNLKLNQYKMSCYYCGIRLNPKIVNEECEVNKSGLGNVTANKKSKTIPHENFQKCGKHFFTQTIDEDDNN